MEYADLASIPKRAAHNPFFLKGMNKMSAIGRFLSSRGGIIVTELVVGVLAPILVMLGNPPNMGVCVACFSRDISGALGLHRAAFTTSGPRLSGLYWDRSLPRTVGAIRDLILLKNVHLFSGLIALVLAAWFDWSDEQRVRALLNLANVEISSVRRLT